jgi:hypothetical protein
MKSLPQMQRILSVAALASLAVIYSARAAENPFANTNTDSAFTAGLTKLKQNAGFIEDQPGQATTDWKPGLQLLVGVKSVENSKRTIHFVQLTTVRPPLTNAAGEPWQPLLRTNHWGWSPTNKTCFISTNYPVRVRVFNATGQLLKEGQTPMAWGMLTNGLFDLCRISFGTYGGQGNSTQGETKKNDAPKSPPDERLIVAMGGGLHWMMGMFSDLQTVPTVADVWGTAQCAFRWPSLWTLAKSIVTGFTLNLQPQFKEVTVANPAVHPAVALYCLPLKINSDERNLTRVEIVVGPAHGAEMLMAGIRTIHARHPTKPKQEFLTQVLATGSVPEP